MVPEKAASGTLTPMTVFLAPEVSHWIEAVSHSQMDVPALLPVVHEASFPASEFHAARALMRAAHSV